MYELQLSELRLFDIYADVLSILFNELLALDD
jgi:hypothetical protein